MYKKIAIFGVIITFSVINLLFSQNVYNYNFSTWTGNFVTAGSSNLLSAPPSGEAYIYVSSNVNGGVHLKNPGISTFGSGSKVMIHCSSSASTANKFSIFGYDGTANSYVKFSIVFADSTGGTGVSGGTFYFCTGTGGSFSNNSGLSPSEIVTGLRWVFATNGTISTDAIKSGNSWRTIDINPFYQGQSNVYTVEIFGNNGTVSNTYTYNGVSQSVASAKQDIYINGVLCANDVDISSNGLPLNSSVNSFMFFATDNKTNNLCAFIDDISYATGISTTYQTYTDYYSKSSGNLDLLTSWTTNLDGSGTQYPPDFAGDLTNGAGKVAMNFNLRNRTTATLGNNLNISGQSCKLKVGDGTNPLTLTIPSGYTFSSSAVEINSNATIKNQSSTSSAFGAFTIYNGGTYQHDCNGGTIPTGTWNTGSLCNITGITNTAPLGSGQVFYNFIWNSPLQSANINLGGLTGFGLNGDMTVTNTGATSGRTLQLTSSNSKTVTLAGNLILNGGHLALTSGTGVEILDIIGNVTLSNSSELYLSQGGSSNGLININGNLTVNSGTLITETGSSTGHTISFSKNGSQSFVNEGSISNDINYNVGSASVLTIHNDIPVNESMNFNVNGTLYCGDYDIIGGGNFSLLNGGTLGIGSQYGITITSETGNIQVTGNRSFGITANYIYYGSVGQVSGDGFPNVINNLTINNPNDVTLVKGTTINGTLNFMSGKINTGNNDIIIGETGSIIGASSSSYFNTNGTGVLKRTVTVYPVAFPIGNDSYTPLILENTGTTDLFGVNVKNSFDHQPLTSCIVNKQWNISEEVTGGSDLSITFQWNATDENPGFSRSNSIYIGHWAGTLWESFFASGGVTGAGPYTVTRSGFTNFSPFALGNDGSLPVEMISFTASAMEKTIHLIWRTGSELNNYGFDIERKSIDNKESWEKIDFIKGQGTVSSATNYEYSDKILKAGKYSYRLKQIDNNGNFKYYELIGDVNISNPVSFMLSQNYPNPFNPKTKIDFRIPNDAVVTVKIFDMSGKEVKTLINGEQRKANYYTLDFDATGLASGVYFYRINADKFTATKKMVLLK